MSPKDGKIRDRVVIIFARFGPYHMARLEAAGEFFDGKSLDLIGLEVAGRDREYLWNVESGAKSFHRTTLCPHDHYQDLTKQEIRKAVQNALDDLNPIAVAAVGWGFPEARAALRWCKKHGVVITLMSESKRDDYPRTWWKEWVKRRIVRQFDAALVGGSPQRDYAAELGIPAERIFLGYDVVDNEYFGRESDLIRRDDVHWRGKLGLPDAYFLTCCRLIEKKNIPGLIEAYSIYRSKCKHPWGLVICGSGELQGMLERKVESLHLKGVIWPGFVQVGDLPKYYGLASAFVLPSTTEQWGLVVNEAMGSGLPVLVSRNCGCAYDLVSEGVNGFRFDPHRPEELAGLMLTVSSDKMDLCKMGNASRRIISQWAPSTFAANLWRAIEAGSRLLKRT